MSRASLALVLISLTLYSTSVCRRTHRFEISGNGCTSAIVTGADGNPTHVHSLDWNVPELQQTLIEVEFHREGKCAFVATTFAGYVGVLSGMKPQSHAVSVGYRNSAKKYRKYLWSSVTGGWPAALLVRHQLESPKTTFKLCNTCMQSSMLPHITQNLLSPQQGMCLRSRCLATQRTMLLCRVWCRAVERHLHFSNSRVCQRKQVACCEILSWVVSFFFLFVLKTFLCRELAYSASGWIAQANIDGGCDDHLDNLNTVVSRESSTGGSNGNVQLSVDRHAYLRDWFARLPARVHDLQRGTFDQLMESPPIRSRETRYCVVMCPANGYFVSSPAGGL